MAKKPQQEDYDLNPLKPTTPAPVDQADDPVKPIGVGIKLSEGKRLTEIAAELGMNRHALLLWLVRDFVKRYEAGDRPETELRRVLKK